MPPVLPFGGSFLIGAGLYKGCPGWRLHILNFLQLHGKFLYKLVGVNRQGICTLSMLCRLCAVLCTFCTVLRAMFCLLTCFFVLFWFIRVWFSVSHFFHRCGKEAPLKRLC